jgi:hypothetical protein
MGGPYVEIALGKEPSAEDRFKVKALFESMNIRPSKREIWPAFSIVSTKLIGGSYERKCLANSSAVGNLRISNLPCSLKEYRISNMEFRMMKFFPAAD